MILKMCKKCGRLKSFSQFYKSKLTSDGFEGMCKNCRRFIMRKQYKSDDVHKRKSKYQKEWNIKNPEKVIIHNARTRLKLRMGVLNAYSGIPPKCACCNEKHIQFLELDHINGRGNKERCRYGAGGGLYNFLKRNKYPKGYRILCSNCNQAIGKYGKCPHNKLK